MRHVTIIEPGIATTFQDPGRPGREHLGVGAAGWVDAATARRLNRAVGNPEHLTVLETAGNLILRFGCNATIATTAMTGPCTIGPNTTVNVPAGQQSWHYVAVEGGFVTTAELGSSSRDTLAAIGPSEPAREERVELGTTVDAFTRVDTVPQHRPTRSIGIVPGPRHGLFPTCPLTALTRQHWNIASASRVGVRLDGPPLTVPVGLNLASEGLIRGAIQVPPNGQPVVMSADHPTTGGYPVPAVVVPEDLHHLCQLLPGETFRFRLHPAPF